MTITYERAADLLRKTIKSAKETPIAVVVVDRGGHTIAAARMDGVGYFNISAATGKAKLSANFGAPTHAVAHMAQQDALLQSALNAAAEFVVLPGGFPIMDGDTVVGGIGVAGGHYAQDQAIVELALR